MEDPERPATSMPEMAQADETLGHHILSQNTRIAFPSLTSIRLGDGCLRFLEWLVLLCSSAPELIDLDVSLVFLKEHLSPKDTEATFPILPSVVTHTTRVQRLRLAYRDDRFEEDGFISPFPTIRSLITHSPALRLSSLNFHERNNVAPRVMVDVLRSQLRLQDLHWYEGAAELGKELDRVHRRTGEAGFSHLKRLVFSECRGFHVVSLQPLSPERLADCK
jgi:hypothetical protein